MFESFLEVLFLLKEMSKFGIEEIYHLSLGAKGTLCESPEIYQVKIGLQFFDM